MFQCMFGVVTPVLGVTFLLFGRNYALTSGFGSAEHVLVIGLDGFGGMYIENATDFLPNIASFYKEGATTTRMRDRNPSVSAPNWAAIITGLGIPESGVKDNHWTPAQDNPGENTTVEEMPPISGAGKVPETMWAVAKEQRPSLRTAVTASWDWIGYLCKTATTTCDNLFEGHESDNVTAVAMMDFIVTKQPNLMFIHYNDIDEAGHASYWGSDRYYSAAREKDVSIGELMDALKTADIFEKTLIIVTADHGGWRNHHGMFSQSNMYTPAFFVGPGVKKGHHISEAANDLDIAPTALHALGLKPGRYMLGKVLEEVFE